MCLTDLIHFSINEDAFSFFFLLNGYVVFEDKLCTLSKFNQIEFPIDTHKLIIQLGINLSLHCSIHYFPLFYSA